MFTHLPMPTPRNARRPTALNEGKARSVYFAGELFSSKHLIGNAYLAEAIYAASHGRYRCCLPQDIELRSSSPQLIRDQDIKALLACDVALFNFDGPELDSGTVVEFMFAKFADIPCVILRSDFRAAGDQGAKGDPWNLMASFYPRSVSVVVNSLAIYKKANTAASRARLDPVTRLAGQHSAASAQTLCEQIALLVVGGLDRAVEREPMMPKHLREAVYTWLALMPGLCGDAKKTAKELQKILAGKIKNELI